MIFSIGLDKGFHKLLLSTVFTGVALKDVNGNKHFTNLVYDMLSVDWTTGDKNKYDNSGGKTVPDFHLPIKVVIAVPYDSGYWDVFWSEYGGDHAEDYLSQNSNYRSINYFYINYTPCAKKCTPNLIHNFQRGGCPEIYAIWPYKISPKGIEEKQVSAIYTLSKTCPIDTWWGFSSYVNAICSLRKEGDLLCSDVKTAIKSKSFRNRNDYALTLINTIKSRKTLQEKMSSLEHIMDNYVEESYPSHQ